MNTHELIDRFVEVAEGAGADFSPIQRAPWIDALEAKLGLRLPESFHSLVTRYEFAPFDLGGIAFYGNTGLHDLDEMPIAIFRDVHLAQGTQGGGLLQFARPATGEYDPICFDTTVQRHKYEYPIVQIDHEQILSFNRIGKRTALHKSFREFVLKVAVLK